MASSERQPDFFLVGAPKCGTTAMHVSLREHPDVFMPAEKEHNHFATDLVPATDPYASREHYLALFRDASFEKRVGETSVFHLYSKSAAENIRAFHADAKILVMLRDPLEFVASYHSQMVWNGDAALADLAEALAAEIALGVVVPVKGDDSVSGLCGKSRGNRGRRHIGNNREAAGAALRADRDTLVGDDVLDRTPLAAQSFTVGKFDRAGLVAYISLDRDRGDAGAGVGWQGGRCREGDHDGADGAVVAIS